MMSDYQWGLGIEHEFHLFHIKKYSKPIVFPTQEIVCNLTKHFKYCCKINANYLSKDIYKHLCCDYCKNYKKNDVSDCWNKYNPLLIDKIKITDSEKKFLLELPEFEYSGRYDCPLISRINYNMVEVITNNYKNAKVKNITKELFNREQKLIQILTKYSKQKINLYGKIKPFSYGAINICKIPKLNSIHFSKYKFTNKKCLDYTGSYHINITLPWKKYTRLSTFIKQHQEFARQIQWIEPLLISAFSSTDPRAVGDSNKYTEGSYRVMITGWGNFAGSDIRKLDFELLDRKATHKIQWRENKYQKQLITYCKSTMGGDLRNISEKFADKTKNEIMKKGEGIEIRIFDHFPTKYIKNLIEIIIIIADNSLKQNYSQKSPMVYKDKDWIKNIKNIINQGWNANLTEEYINKLKTNLDIKFDCESTKTYDIFTCLIKELFEKNKNGLFQTLTKTTNKLPYIPKINRYSWEFSFNKQKLNTKLQTILKQQDSFTLNQFKHLFYKHFDKKIWKHDVEDILYSLQSSKIILLTEKNGEIISIEKNT